MALPDFTMRGLLEAGAHFGHQSHRWNPKMAPYIFGARNNIHIIDLAQTVPLLHQALKTISDTVSKGGRVLFVGTKRQAQEAIADAAKRSAQYYINSRWLGGTLTNWKTISGSITRLRKLDEQLSAGASGITKKERLLLTRERDKLEKALGGIKDMGGTPDLISVIDATKTARDQEANRLRFPSSPCSTPIAIGWRHPSDPGNDDAGRINALRSHCEPPSTAFHATRRGESISADESPAPGPRAGTRPVVRQFGPPRSPARMRIRLSKPSTAAARRRASPPSCARRPAARQAERRRRLSLLATCRVTPADVSSTAS
jgi:small subunit ribosomal protein S2